MRGEAEVAILGAGPAGARAAELLARQGVSVALYDPKAPWEKPCGGGLTPPAFEEIPELAELIPVSRGIDRARVEISPAQGIWVPLERPMRVVSRRTLGRWQLDRAVSAGATLVPSKVTSLRRSGEGWWLDTDEGAREVPFVIGADGAASLVRRVAAPGFSVELAPTRVAYPAGAGPSPGTAVLKFYGGLAGYLWDFPRPDHRSVGIGVPNGTWRRPTMDAEIDGYRASSEPCGCSGLERAGAVIGTAQLGHGDFSAIAGVDFALLGDAAGFADPLTGEGIQNALRSATLFAEAWRSGDVRTYPRLARRAFAREFAVARGIRRWVFEGELGLGLIRYAMSSDVGYGLVGSIVNAVNEHDGRILRLATRGARGWRRARAGSSEEIRGGRTPVPCGCGACHRDGVEAERCNPSAAA